MIIMYARVQPLIVMEMELIVAQSSTYCEYIFPASMNVRLAKFLNKYFEIKNTKCVKSLIHVVPKSID